MGFTYPFTKDNHFDTYPSIDPALPALSAAGKSVLITGGASGIGLETAKAFATAKASRIILLARTAANLEKAKAEITKAHPSAKVEIYTTNIVSADAVEKAFESARVGGEIDVVILSAAVGAPFHDSLSTVKEELENNIAINFNGNLNVVKTFLSTGKVDKKTIINVSTGAVHLVIPNLAIYAASKAFWTHYLQHTYAEQKENGLTVFQVHPGTIFTGLASDAGLKEDSFEWEQIALPAHYNVWLTSPEAKFLSGKFLWSAWDVQELQARKEEILGNPALLTLGLQVK